MNIDSIHNGIVIDHITAGRGMRLYQLLKLDALDCPVALIKNVPSHKIGKKDIIKVDAVLDVNTDLLGFVDPGVTVNVIRNDQLIEKRSVCLPVRMTNVLFCRNPRCITSTEQELPHIFLLTDADTRTYRCLYCEAKGE